VAEVLIFDGITRLDYPVERVLDAAKGCAEVVVVGFDAEGKFYFSSSKANGPDALWLLELAKKRLMDIGSGC